MTPESLVKHHILQNQTGLVNFLFECDFELEEEIANKYVSAREQLLDMSEKDIWYVIDYCYNSLEIISKDDFLALFVGTSIGELVEFVLEHELEGEFVLEQEPKDIFEWVLIDEWLADKLEENGEAILSLYGSKWWGRTGYGQMYELDDVIQKIAKEY